MTDAQPPMPPASAPRLAARLRTLARTDAVLRPVGGAAPLLVWPACAAAAVALHAAGHPMAGILAALAAPPAQALAARLRRPAGELAAAGAVLTRPEAEAVAAARLDHDARTGRATAALLLQITEPVHSAGWTDAEAERAMILLRDRVAAALRERDAVFRLGDRTVAAVLHPARRVDLDVVLGVADRMQAAVAEPLSIDGRAFHLASHVGICTGAMAPRPDGAALLSAASCALREAIRHEAGAARVFTPELRREEETGHRLARQVGPALESGEIRAWFQPQVDARTRRLAGMEALVRWHHPDLGVLPPARFLPAIGVAGLDAALGERVLRDALAALEAWDDAGFGVEQVGINVSKAELRDPHLADRFVWEIDRCGLPPERIAVEILETVTAEDADDVVLRNLRSLRAAGLRLDLDDFGTGAAAIRQIARFGAHRIKIDRSFVAGIERDPETRRIVAAILGLAAEMGIDTLAEGVETEAQAEVLAEMGCRQLQGYAIARPMPLAATLAWARNRSPARPCLAEVRPHGTA
ncbi:GGDEF domain-containing phosphodiesterase [Jannaschia sp. W003]|uniref:GGDEF domain-containing phosphodiesterase n=1 Tax=Jannaschia sp. W003 TaxID=2867012 RepID=UPI0021A47F48|nr:GGDEF domain-containing phosphodiesterase [Jannaschia sp. W003]UWQ20046.1 GGDEF domain-containing phosphodiesterase [Jannaschia sp. W003]